MEGICRMFTEGYSWIITEIKGNTASSIFKANFWILTCDKFWVITHHNTVTAVKLKCSFFANKNSARAIFTTSVTCTVTTETIPIGNSIPWTVYTNWNTLTDASI